MAIRHIVTIRVASGRAAEFTAAFDALRAVTLPEPGCEQYELFQSHSDPDILVILERWTDRELLHRHMTGERDGNAALVDALVRLWAPGTTPQVEQFED
ncbi:putative quinol monooxygenase [Nocardia sp. alder85J]|uniref:putative quinol monooxygenase n=1 Tax=Nocardia sp. alder85J TaxID=2862949 RepID=UPI001CD499EF|nr:antibiotic biosynthesis monooxygenase family protein [Nocardia sp. alder85J]MCX4094388.1 antibiotic biosynthesis monooxygenase [Nocardia sp. alder85J]